MAATGGASAAARGQSNPPPTGQGTPTTLFGGGEPKKETTPAKDLKRKITDLNLEIVVIDKVPDLTLIVGSSTHVKGQKAFQVNKGSFRNVSLVWTKMLEGNWKESTMSEIRFPDDDCDAFVLILHIAHFQISYLPDKLSQQELLELAVLTDKYELQTAVRMSLDFKRWMEPYHNLGALRPAHTDLQDFAIVTAAFQLQSDYEYLVNRLAMKVQIDDSGDYYYNDNQQQRVTLRSDVPPRVIQEIERVRCDILSAWVACCTVALNDAIKAPLPPCRKSLCAANKVGIMVVALQAAGLYPSPASTEDLHRSVLSYWRDIKNMGDKHKSYRPFEQSGSGRYASYASSCSFEKCFGDFGIVKDAKATLERHAHKDVLKQCQAVGNVADNVPETEEDIGIVEIEDHIVEIEDDIFYHTYY